MGANALFPWALAGFSPQQAIDDVCVVIREEDRNNFEHAVAGIALTRVIPGGATRQESVHAGLEGIRETNPDFVLVHDAVRPFVSLGLIGRVVNALDTADAVAPLLPVTDSLHSETEEGFDAIPRKGLFRAQTPQGFRFAAILEAHRRFSCDSFSDDFALAQRAGLSLASVQGEKKNFKITTQEDLILAERIATAIPDVRTGFGFDAHRFGKGDHVRLCGVKISHGQRLKGYSDGDVGLHALTDAILGALGAGDIGMHFPASDERWRGHSSDVFLRRAVELARQDNARIAHLDVTLICETPKLESFRDAMRIRVAEISGIDVDRVSVKATTTDGLGFTGRGEGIAAQAVATLHLY
ncbi:MAG: 2-C-methyl-D-erythritol 2,4-cyclodiphosphate synthase [Alphaproteobacteria bacterium]